MTGGDEQLNRARIAAVWRFLERSLIERDLDETRTLLSRDFVLHMPLRATRLSSPWSWTLAMRFFLNGLSDIRIERGDSFGDGDVIAVRFTVEGGHTGALGEIAPTGKTIRVTALSLWRFTGPVIREAWFELSLWDAVRQIDAVELCNSVVQYQS
ncbi:MAG: hypothetical protein EXR75_14695 [Myxococcales bacterium]|nr:hypothetical protein [Myxococcales bacterium]